MKLAPYFEVNGNRYEIHRSRYLMTELEKLSESSNIEDDAGEKLVKLREQALKLDKIKRRSEELYDAYLETFSPEAEELYKRAQAEYEKLFNEVMPQLGKNGVLNRVKKAGVDNSEKLVITALQRDESGKVIRSKEEAEEIWGSYVDEVGQEIAEEWLDAFTLHITGKDEQESDNSFLAQAKARAEQQSENRKQGLAKINK